MVNASKTKFVVFTTKTIHSDTSINLDNHLIKTSDSHNFLGIHINNNKTFSDHIGYISNKVSKTIGILCKIKHFVPETVLKSIYISLVQSFLLYGVLVWDSAYHSNLKPLLTLQNRAVRLISNSHYLQHADPIFNRLNILKLQDLYKIRCLKYMYSVTF